MWQSIASSMNWNGLRVSAVRNADKHNASLSLAVPDATQAQQGRDRFVQPLAHPRHALCLRKYGCLPVADEKCDESLSTSPFGIEFGIQAALPIVRRAIRLPGRNRGQSDAKRHILPIGQLVARFSVWRSADLSGRDR